MNQQTNKLSYIFNSYGIHVGIVEVFACHTPYKTIAGRTAPCMNAPGRRYYGVKVIYQYMSCFLALVSAIPLPAAANGNCMVLSLNTHHHAPL